MQKILYFDVEYANTKNRSICQMGLLLEFFPSGEPIFPEKNIYINPEDGFDGFCSDIHHISYDMVKDSPTFPEVWDSIKDYFKDAIIIGHSVAAADLNTLCRNLKRYNIEIPQFKYICTLDLAYQYLDDYIENYKLNTLCKYFDIDIDNHHDAFDDACAASDVFKCLVKKYNIDINKHIKTYKFNNNREFESYLDNNKRLNSIIEFYGMIKGFVLDKKIVKEEIDYILKWRNENYKYSNYQEIKDIIDTIDKIVFDGVITLEDVLKLKKIIKQYVKERLADPITFSTKILNGILKGIIVDNVITIEEAESLKKWLYKHLELKSHYPFEQIFQLLETILEDNEITKKESEFLIQVINDLLNPLDKIQKEINSLNGKHICLTGKFIYGQKSDIEQLLISDGCFIDKNVKKDTDILIVGDSECMAYAYGNYGLKVQKAIDFNCKGSNIQIIKENEFFCNKIGVLK